MAGGATSARFSHFGDDLLEWEFFFSTEQMNESAMKSNVFVTSS